VDLVGRLVVYSSAAHPARYGEHHIPEQRGSASNVARANRATEATVEFHAAVAADAIHVEQQAVAHRIGDRFPDEQARCQVAGIGPAGRQQVIRHDLVPGAEDRGLHRARGIYGGMDTAAAALEARVDQKLARRQIYGATHPSLLKVLAVESV